MKFAVFALATTLALSSGLAAAQTTGEVMDNSPSGGAMAVDLLFVRPIALVGTVLGLGLFVVSLPFSVVQGELPAEPARKLVVEPAKFTFARPLGDTDYTPLR